MIFWIGFVIMVLNEGFVIMRHQSPLFARWRKALIKQFGDNWKKFHSIMDYVWVGAVINGIIFTSWWCCVLLFVYVPRWVKTF